MTVLYVPSSQRLSPTPGTGREREFFIDNLLARIHFIIEMIRWTGLAPWQFKFPFPEQALSNPDKTEYEKQKAEDPEFYRDANSLAVSPCYRWT